MHCHAPVHRIVLNDRLGQAVPASFVLKSLKPSTADADPLGVTLSSPQLAANRGRRA
jgi:hypothetical protein